MQKLYVVEYSKKQKCFHQDELMHVISLNYRKFVEGAQNDWQIIGVFETTKEAEEFCERYCKDVRNK